MEEHEVFANIDKELQFMGRDLNDWIFSLVTGMAAFVFIFKPLTQSDWLSLLLYVGTSWGLLTLTTWYKDNFPPYIVYYTSEWMSQGDLYVVQPDTQVAPLLITEEMVARETRRDTERKQLVKLSQEERAARRRGKTYDARERAQQIKTLQESQATNKAAGNKSNNTRQKRLAVAGLSEEDIPIPEDADGTYDPNADQALLAATALRSRREALQGAQADLQAREELRIEREARTQETAGRPGSRPGSTPGSTPGNQPTHTTKQRNKRRK